MSNKDSGFGTGMELRKETTSRGALGGRIGKPKPKEGGSHTLPDMLRWTKITTNNVDNIINHSPCGVSLK